MQSRWDSKNSVILQQKIKTVLDPIRARHNYYISAKANMLKSVEDHFFTDINKDKFLEVTRLVAGSLNVEPVNKQLLEILGHFTQTIKEAD